ncbi:unnamed protein product [Rotaria magnacalcarata]|uniref:Uncharacterized protein n=1 Tax=Rotaria magnacalcarata TaxID=392030 RepID=A0A819NE92_9BILA|nr:unnamed protein product [Rotaria magnacalcarata]
MLLMFLVVINIDMPLKNYYFCPLWAESKANCTFRKLFKHIRYVHGRQGNFKVRCELGPLCGTTYSTFATYKSHIYREHGDILDENSCQEAIQVEKNTDNDDTLVSICDETDVDFQIELNDVEDEQSAVEEEIDFDDTISWPSLKEIIPELSEAKKNLNSFEKFYLQFILNLREGHSLPQNIIQAVTFGVRSLIEFIYELLKAHIKSSLFVDQRTATRSSTTEFILLTDALSTLDLSQNKIGDEGAQHIANALNTKKILTTLNLSVNNIGDEGARHIANALSNNKTLTTLDLHKNQIGAKGAQRVANALDNNKALTTLDLCFTDIGDKVAKHCICAE